MRPTKRRNRGQSSVPGIDVGEYYRLALSGRISAPANPAYRDIEEHFRGIRRTN